VDPAAVARPGQRDPRRARRPRRVLRRPRRRLRPPPRPGAPERAAGAAVRRAGGDGGPLRPGEPPPPPRPRPASAPPARSPGGRQRHAPRPGDLPRCRDGRAPARHGADGRHPGGAGRGPPAMPGRGRRRPRAGPALRRQHLRRHARGARHHLLAPPALGDGLGRGGARGPGPRRGGARAPVVPGRRAGDVSRPRHRHGAGAGGGRRGGRSAPDAGRHPRDDHGTGAGHPEPGQGPGRTAGAPAPGQRALPDGRRRRLRRAPDGARPLAPRPGGADGFVPRRRHREHARRDQASFRHSRRSSPKTTASWASPSWK
jgi:hypothetical protein